MAEWNKYKRKYWDVGEDQSISLANQPMIRLMRSIILCDAKVHDTFCMEKHINCSKLKFDPRYCGVVLRISLPEGAEEEFETLSGFKLSEPSKVVTFQPARSRGWYANPRPLRENEANSAMEIAMQGQCGYGSEI